MKMYDVEITETLQRTVSVEANSREEAEHWCSRYTEPQTQKCGSYVVKIQRSCRFLFRIEILC